MRIKKLISIFLIISLVPTSILGIYTTNLIKEYVNGRTSQEIEADIATLSKEIESFFNGVEKDVGFLSKSDSLLNFLDAQNSENEIDITEYKLGLGNLFHDFSEANGIYDQIRFIDASGQETIRINMEGLSPRILDDDELQNKASRYYFSETMQLGFGEIYASPLDLNVEHGEVEIPYKPMIRFSTPVYDRSGAKRGIMILNVYAEPVLLKVKDAPFPGVTYLVDQDGFYIEHPDDVKEWGRVLGTDENLANEHQQVAPLILTEKMEIIETDQDHIVTKFISYNQQDQDNQLILINFIPISEILKPYHRIITALYVTLLLSFVAAIGTGLLFSKKLAGPLTRLAEGAKTLALGDLNVHIPVTSDDELGELAESFNSMAKALKNSYNSLEEKVKLRTRELDEANWTLGERAKELTFTYQVIHEMQNKLPLPQLAQKINEYLVPAMQFPDATAPVIIIGNEKIQHDRFKDDLKYFITSEIQDGEKKHGYVSVYYTEKLPFLDEEQDLVDALAANLGEYISMLKLEEEVNKLSNAVDQANSTIIITDSNGLIEYANSAFYEIFGYTEAEVYGRTPRIINSGVHPPEIYQQLWDTILAGEIWVGDLQNRTKSGEAIWMHITITPIKTPERILIFLCFHPLE